MKEKERMLSGKLYDPYKIDDHSWERSREALEIFNSMSYKQEKERMQVLRDIFGCLPQDAVIMPPFYCDKGSQIYVGRHFYANTGLLILDEAKVEIGDDVFMAPRVCIYTAAHPLDADVRRTGLEYAKGVVIGSDVWIGGNVVINPGVAIGDNVVIGSGSVVTKDISSGVVAAGNPCRVIREITEEDREYWHKEMQEYLNDNDVQRI